MVWPGFWSRPAVGHQRAGLGSYPTGYLQGGQRNSRESVDIEVEVNVSERIPLYPLQQARLRCNTEQP